MPLLLQPDIVKPIGKKLPTSLNSGTTVLLFTRRGAGRDPQKTYNSKSNQKTKIRRRWGSSAKYKPTFVTLKIQLRWVFYRSKLLDRGINEISARQKNDLT